ncbi:MAG: acyl-CoA dehydrogenase family protein [Pseudomonadales bacterium]|jgi:alkylation response protein AidB-like acyl-CoA dehydrogenase|nr:acyl-CoA dehydrogenase family protein [Pseudomonadales bacterium]|tara:strand:- start:18644 stop:19756 length:1113 start_codon:yes stop_codon:yes gene_type:complete
MSNAISFSEEQAMLLDTAMDFCSTHSPITSVRTRIEEESDFSDDLWRQVIDLGWTAIIIPESYAGLGLSMTDLVPIVESMGRNLMTTPLVSSTLAAHALIEGGSEEQKNTWLPRIAQGAIATIALAEAEGSWNLKQLTSSGTRINGKVQLSGSKNLVENAAAADVILISINLEGEPVLALIEKSLIPDGALTREIIIDETRRAYQLDLDGIIIDESMLLASCCLKKIEYATLLLLCAEMAGGHAAVLNVIVEYLNTRKQFDRYIGSYQALKHPTVQILIDMEASRSHLYHAATIWNTATEDELEIALRMAKAHASESFAHAGDRAVQFHGGFGFTYECDAQLFLRRALWCQYQFGDEKYHRQLLAPLLLD